MNLPQCRGKGGRRSLELANAIAACIEIERNYFDVNEDNKWNIFGTRKTEFMPIWHIE